MRSIFPTLVFLFVAGGCAEQEPPYGREHTKVLATKRRQVWAVAPVVNLSGERGVDPFLQADLVFQQLQQVQGVTVIPVNRVAEIYANLRIERVASPDQAAIICDLLQCDGLIIPTASTYDTYNRP